MNSSSMAKSDSVELKPMHRLPCLIILAGFSFLLLPIPLWNGLLISTFGLFLLIQSFTLRLKFTSEDLIVLQFNKQIRSFPYKNWISWRIFLPQLPGILYFRETASPHLLPILFDRKMLEEQLTLRVGTLEIKSKSN